MNANKRLFTVPFSKSRGTSRWATFEPQGGEVSENWMGGTVNNDRISDALEAHDWYNGHAYGEDKNPEEYLNLEFIQNNVHNWAGGFGGSMGHMTEVPVAGFDPIFFMHHCNIDIQFAIWQGLNEKNPNNWFDHLEKEYDDDGTWNIPPGTKPTPETPLPHFTRIRRAFASTRMASKDWIPPGYSYLELQSLLDEYKTDGQFDYTKYTEDIRKQLTKLYRPLALPTVSAWHNDLLKSDIIVNVTYDRYYSPITHTNSKTRTNNGLPPTIYLFLGEKDKFDTYKGLRKFHSYLFPAPSPR
ncbi:common central domain of tyrosinase-domain-containing protein [Lasiosphaeria hispida]|uniref:tyrosinase n=1 Tax=Lasiosphaeria hispida TaxID=260671 RepID=A0AAJ0MCE0_9PEZI|nr:common central domain of tyrosinase-domain-containing protein [Lasiosphaeria hispida]